MPDPSRAARPAAHPDVVLAICCLSLLLAGMDATIVNVALPSIERALHSTLSGMQWVLDGYTLVVASFLMLAGSMSDRFGRRRVFQIGLGTFCFGSLLCSLAHGVGQLVAFRAVQGLGASMLNPVALSIVANVFPNARDRARAVGIWGAVGGISFAAGPLLGGALTETVGWRAIFWVNVPIALAAIVLAAIYVPESKAPQARASDPVGQALVIAGLGSLTYAIIEGGHAGWHSPLILGLFGLAAVSLAAFLLYEPRRQQPLLDLSFFRSIPFSTATVLGLVSFASFAGFLFLTAIYMQQERGISAFRTGLTALPLAIATMICSPLSGRMVGRFGPRPSLLVSGLAFMASSGLLTRLEVSTPVAVLLLAYGLFGVGLGMVNPAISNSAVAGMPLSQAGVAAAVASTSRQVGSALGVALAGTVVAVTRVEGHGALTRATHPVWWGMAGCGSVVLLAGVVSGTEWSRSSAARVKTLFGAEQPTQ